MRMVVAVLLSVVVTVITGCGSTEKAPQPIVKLIEADAFYAPADPAYAKVSVRHSEGTDADSYPAAKATLLVDAADADRWALVGTSYDLNIAQDGDEDLTGRYLSFAIGVDSSLHYGKRDGYSYLLAEPAEQESYVPYAFITAVGLTRDEILTLAGGTGWDNGYALIHAGSLPAGMNPLVSSLVNPSSAAHEITVAAGDGTEITIRTVQTEPDVLRLYAAARPGAEPVTVRGQDGYRTQDKKSVNYAWAEDGYLIVVSGPSDQDLLALIEDLQQRPASELGF